VYVDIDDLEVLRHLKRWKVTGPHEFVFHPTAVRERYQRCSLDPILRSASKAQNSHIVPCAADKFHQIKRSLVNARDSD
jgi:hypothetical protein